MKVESSIILEHIVDLAEERSEVPDTDVLGHLQAGNLVVLALGDGDITVVHAQDARLRLLNASATKTLVAPGSLVATESDTSNVSAIVDRGILGESSPAASNVEHALASLEFNLLADHLELVVLNLLESLLLGDVRDNTRSVDHPWSQEPAVEVVAAVVMVTDLLLICRLLDSRSISPEKSGTYPENGSG